MSATITELPAALVSVAEGFGRLVAAGDMTPGSCRGAIGAICAHHPRVAASSFDVAIEALCDIAFAIAYAPALQAQRDITAGIAPLLEKRAPRATILRAACRLAEARLLRPDVAAIVDHAICAELAKAGAP